MCHVDRAALSVLTPVDNGKLANQIATLLPIVVKKRGVEGFIELRTLAFQIPGFKSLYVPSACSSRVKKKKGTVLQASSLAVPL